MSEIGAAGGGHTDGKTEDRSSGLRTSSRSTPGLDTGSLVAGCVAIGAGIGTLGLPANLNSLFASRLHVNGADLTWIGDTAFVGAAVSAYLLGSLADRLGRRRVMLVSALLIVIGQLVSAFGTTKEVLWVGQGAAGIGIGGLSAVSLAVVVTAVPRSADRSRYYAAFAASLTLGSVGSALLGVFLAEGTTYRWAFVGMATVAAIAFGLIAVLCSESRPEVPRAFDAAGQITLAVALCALLWAVIEGSATHWGRIAVILAFCLAALLLAGFLWIERRPGGMIDLGIFRTPAFAASAAAAFVSFFAFAACVYSYAIRVQFTQGHDTRFTALGLVVLGSVAGLSGYASQAVLTRRGGARPLLVIGFVAFAVGAVWLRELSLGTAGFVSLLPFFILVGFGQGTTTAGMTAAAVESLGQERESLASSTQGVLRQLGSPIGLALIGALIFSRSQSAFATALSHLPVPAALGHVAAGVNGQAGVLGVLESGLAAKSPALGGASVTALHGAIGDALWVVVILCLVTAAGAAVTVRSRVSATR
jgi:MFS family permease